MGSSSASFGALLRQMRISAALSQVELAERTGLSERGISDLERGVRQGPRPESLRLLADALSLAAPDREAFFAAAHLERPNRSATGRTVSVRLPQPATPLLGRQQELSGLHALLSREDVRLVTLTGMGGIGKTRLAIDIAWQLSGAFRDGVVFVDLAPLTDPALVIPTIAATLALREAGPQQGMTTLVAALRERRMLLLLDNCEQVMAATPEIAELMAACPGLTLLATSREALKLRGEREWPVVPLALPELVIDRPPLVAELQRSPAVALFIARAEASDPHFVLTTENALAVSTVCHRVDGIPLAIELAAARVKLLPPAALATRLEQRLTLLTGGARDAPARQRTLRAALAWSYGLLSPDEQELFRRLGVFMGGWTLDAAAAVADPMEGQHVLDTLGSLLDKSLVRGDDDGSTSRFGMYETVREFALERLEEEGDGDIARERHAAYYLEFAEQAAVELEGPTQRRWIGLLEREHPNLRAAFTTLEVRGDDAGYLRLTNALGWYWFFHAHAREGLPHFERTLARESGMTLDRARTLHGAGELAYACGAYAKADGWLQEGEALAQAFGETSLRILCVMTRGAVAEHLGDEASAWAFFEAGLTLAREAGMARLMGEILPNLSDAAYRRGDLDQAERFALDALPLLQASGNAFMESQNFGNVAQVALACGAIREAAEAFAQALRIAEEISSPWIVANGIAGAAAVSTALGNHERAARLLGAADAERERSGHPRMPHFGLFAQTQDAVRFTLGDEAFLAGWNTGRALATEEAVAETRAVFTAAHWAVTQPR